MDTLPLTFILTESGMYQKIVWERNDKFYIDVVQSNSNLLYYICSTKKRLSGSVIVSYMNNIYKSYINQQNYKDQQIQPEGERSMNNRRLFLNQNLQFQRPKSKQQNGSQANIFKFLNNTRDQNSKTIYKKDDSPPINPVNKRIRINKFFLFMEKKKKKKTTQQKNKSRQIESQKLKKSLQNIKIKRQHSMNMKIIK